MFPFPFLKKNKISINYNYTPFSLPFCHPNPSHVLSLDTYLVSWVLLLKLVTSFSLIVFVSKFINMWVQPAESAHCCLCIYDFRADHLLLNTNYKFISGQDWFSLSVACNSLLCFYWLHQVEVTWQPWKLNNKEWNIWQIHNFLVYINWSL